MGPGPRRGPRDVRIEHLERDKAELIEDRDRLERENATLIEERDHWKRRSEHLEKELEAARRAGRRQAAPFAKDRRQGTGRRPGRRAGAEYGKQGCRRPPPRADETHAAPAPTRCPDCGGAVAVERVAAQYQEDVPDVRPLVRRFDVEVGRCAQCRRRVQGRHPLQTSDALGAAGVQWGPNVAALTAELHTESGLPLEKTARVLRTRFGLHVTRGGLVRLLHRTADAAAPAYAALCEQVRRSPVVTPDETGWRVDATRHWLWRSPPRRRRSAPSAPAAGLPTRRRCPAPTSRACWCGTDGRRIAASRTRPTRPAWRICCGAARTCGPIIPTAPGPPPCRRSCRTPSPCGPAATPAASASTASRQPADGSKPGSAG